MTYYKQRTNDALSNDYGAYDPWDALCKAIVTTAVEDYKKALKRNNKNEISSIEVFLLSPWAEELSGIPGDKIVNTIRKQMKCNLLKPNLKTVKKRF